MIKYLNLDQSDGVMEITSLQWTKPLSLTLEISVLFSLLCLTEKWEPFLLAYFYVYFHSVYLHNLLNIFQWIKIDDKQVL